MTNWGTYSDSHNAWRRRPEQRKKLAAYAREYRKTHPQVGRYKTKAYRKKHSEWMKGWDMNRRELVNRQKMKPCMDCGVQYNPWVMDFDHREGEIKVDCVGTLFQKHRPLKIIQDEINKCDVVCSNCHRDRTHRRKLSKSKIKIGGY